LQNKPRLIYQPQYHVAENNNDSKLNSDDSHAGRYWISTLVYKCDPMSRRLQNQELMNICEDFSRFIMKEIIHFDRKYFDPELELARPQY
jgi:uncharacterized protein YbcC (UPF0753/DUF2309 family)